MENYDFSEFLEAYKGDLIGAINALNQADLNQLTNEILSVMDNGGTIHFIGNGGSAATPSHSAGDWSKELVSRPFATQTIPLR